MESEDPPNKPRIPINLKGFRAFPPELRQKIFDLHFAGSEIFSGKEEALVKALKEHGDSEIHDEAKSTYFTSSKFHISAEPLKNVYFIHHEGLDKNWTHLVTNLQFDVEMTTRSMITLNGPWISKNGRMDLLDISPGEGLRNIIEAKMVLENFPNVTQLALNFQNFCQSHALKYGEMYFSQHGFMKLLYLRMLVTKLRFLKKLSFIFVEGKDVAESNVLLIAENKATNGPQKMAQSDLLNMFENTTIPRISAAFRLHPKLGSVRESSNCIRVLNRHSDIPRLVLQENFMPYTTEVHEKYEVVWFWEAEEGETLEWRLIPSVNRRA